MLINAIQLIGLPVSLCPEECTNWTAVPLFAGGLEVRHSLPLLVLLLRTIQLSIDTNLLAPSAAA